MPELPTEAEFEEMLRAVDGFLGLSRHQGRKLLELVKTWKVLLQDRLVQAYLNEDEVQNGYQCLCCIDVAGRHKDDCTDMALLREWRRWIGAKP